MADFDKPRPEIEPTWVGIIPTELPGPIERTHVSTFIPKRHDIKPGK